ncbi:integrin alpha-PS1-like isoform X2 [Anopheles albimanus]|uniref:integrin alpha-PS1-like isoform X2 n=1 Tax=Anopheles albimanus TaxID=7167 RepID=UPI001640F23B|nr:integrin alpha-PS1-like isoform X2 [Anopheles albimanus]
MMLMLWGVLLALICGASLFNLETHQIVEKRGLPGSYFGYSVAGHNQRGTRSNANRTTSWILVGAPLGQNLQPGSNRSGALYRCPVTLATDDCLQVVTDGLRTATGSYEQRQSAIRSRKSKNDIDDELESDDPASGRSNLVPPGADEIKTNQWLGVSVETGGQENKIFVCAHRYIKVSKPQPYTFAGNASASDSPGLYLGQGICYVLNEDFSFGFAVEVCRGRSIEREHQQYAFCQSGTSSAVLVDGTALIGTPGAMTWKGTLFSVAIEGDFLSRDKFQYYAPHDNVNSPVPNYSYLGMAVTGGRFFGNYMTYAGGAPRAGQGNGEVVIFSNVQRKNPFDKDLSLVGEQFGSGFGSTLISVDVNGDSLLDLLVGAPNFFNRTDGGAVYVYLNRGTTFDQHYNQRLTGRLESRFGTAIAACGDLNRDGMNDVAIGAPYELGGRGRVYLYSGTADGLSSEPTQLIDPQDFQQSAPWQTFGSSLAGNYDLDGNSYPDLIVGSYGSDRVAALLSRPIINIRTYEELSVENQGSEAIDPAKTGCAADPQANVTCFTFRACSAIDDGIATVNGGAAPLTDSYLDLRFTIEAETFLKERKFSRVSLGLGSASGGASWPTVRTNVLSERFRLSASGSAPSDTTVCHTVTAYLNEGTRDIQNPLKFRINYTLDDSAGSVRGGAGGGGRNGLPVLQPILNRTAAERTFVVPFQKDCGPDGLCRSALVLQTVELVGLTRNGTDTYYIVLGRDRKLSLVINVLNGADSAYETHLYVQHDQLLTYAGTKGVTVCGAYNATLVNCSIGNPLKRNGSKQLSLKFDAESLEEDGYGRGDADGLTISLLVFVNTTSIDRGLQPRRIQLRIVRMAKLSITGVARPEQVFYGGGSSEIVGESAIKKLEEVGMPIEHVYEIYNDGPWRAPVIRLMIDWPLQVANNKPQGKWLLYLDALPTLDMSTRAKGQERTYCEVLRKPELIGDRSPINPLELHGTRNRTAGTLRRVRRDRAMVLRPSATDGAIQMDCPSLTAKCVRIVCDIYALSPKAHVLVTVTARLWNATLVGDYPRVDVVRIGSSAHFTVEGLDDIDVLTGLDTGTQQTLMVRTEAFPEMGPPAVPAMPWWLLALAIIGGLLLLALVIYGLARIGFFRRQRHAGNDLTLSGNLERRKPSTGGGDGAGKRDSSTGGGERKPFLSGRRT